jgi:hypothetical protein
VTIASSSAPFVKAGFWAEWTNSREAAGPQLTGEPIPIQPRRHPPNPLASFSRRRRMPLQDTRAGTPA